MKSFILKNKSSIGVIDDPFNILTSKEREELKDYKYEHTIVLLLKMNFKIYSIISYEAGYEIVIFTKKSINSRILKR
jgi:hypothetical protein